MHLLPERVGKVEDIHCPVCKHQTPHTVHAAYKTTWHNEDIISVGATHEFLICGGCWSGAYRENSWCSEEPERTITFHPPRGENSRQPKQCPNVPWESKLNPVYRQTIIAFNNDLFTLAGAGARLLIEGVCKEQGVDDGPIFDHQNGAQAIRLETGAPIIRDNLEGKINGMAERGIIGHMQARHLHQIRFLGNDSAHNLYIPDREDVGFALDIVEHIFDLVYEQPEKAKALSERKRPAKK